MAGGQPEITAPSSMAPPAEVSHPAVALFDLDRTLLAGSSLVAFGRALSAAGLLDRRAVLRATVTDATFRRRGASDSFAGRVRDRASRLAAGLDREVAVGLARTVAGELVEEMEPAARMLVERHLDRGDFCVVLSASPQELVELIASAVGAHRAVGTRAEVVDGRYTGALDGPFCYGEGKLQRLRESVGPLDMARTWAYADSASDLPVLRAAGHPVAVNPDRTLRQVARASGWPILRLG